MSSINDLDMDLDNNTEFQQFLKNANPSTAMLREIREECQAELDRGMNFMAKVTEAVVNKVKQDAAAGRLAVSSNVENEPPATELKSGRGKRSLRSSTIGKKQGSIAGEIRDSLYYLKLFTESDGNVDVLPYGKILVQVQTMPGESKTHQAPMVFLVEPPELGSRRRCRIGRDAKDCEITLQHDIEVSSKHGVLTQSKGQYFYEDTGSSNGSHFVSGDRLEELTMKIPYPLTNGTILHLGRCRLTLHFVSL